MNCQGCGKAFSDGDTAYEQYWDEIEVSGTTAMRQTVRKIVCEDCA